MEETRLMLQGNKVFTPETSFCDSVDPENNLNLEFIEIPIENSFKSCHLTKAYSSCRKTYHKTTGLQFRKYSCYNCKNFGHFSPITTKCRKNLEEVVKAFTIIRQ